MLATGNISSSPNYNHFHHLPSFYHSQYVDIDYKDLRDKRVLVLGTSLGGIDASLLLHEGSENGAHRPRVVMASKRGRLPAVKNELIEYQYTELITPEVRSHHSYHTLNY